MGHKKGEHCPEPNICKICGKFIDPKKAHHHSLAEMQKLNTAGNPLDPSDTTVADKFWQKSGLR